MELLKEAIEKFAEIYKQAQTCGVKDASAVTLATASMDGRPSARTVLLKGFDHHGFVFFTNHESRKGQHLHSNPRAALCFYWPPMDQQIHVEGSVSPVTHEEADAYWKTRPRESQIGAWASMQSSMLDSRSTLETRFSEFEQKYLNHPVPRPKWWSGYRVSPYRIEFWHAGAHRLHHRLLYEIQGSGWKKTLLFP